MLLVFKWVCGAPLFPGDGSAQSMVIIHNLKVGACILRWGIN